MRRSHKPEAPGSNPGAGTTMPAWRNLADAHGSDPCCCGFDSHRWYQIRKPMLQGWAARTPNPCGWVRFPGLPPPPWRVQPARASPDKRVIEGSIPSSRTTKGAVAQRESTAMASQGSGFDSPRFHHHGEVSGRVSPPAGKRARPVAPGCAGSNPVFSAIPPIPRKG